MTIPNLNYDQCAGAAVQAALELSRDLKADDFADVKVSDMLDPFKLARRKAETIGQLAATILETMHLRNTIPVGVQGSIAQVIGGPPPCGTAFTGY